MTIEAGRRPDRTAKAPPVNARGGVVREIADRRLAELGPGLDAMTETHLRRKVAAAPPPRPFAARLAEPGLHLIAEIKRRSPSAGAIAGPREDIVARARAYEAGGAASISVLCEPHSFGGSVEDMALVRRSISLPVLAKEFVVHRRQLAVLRAAGADAVLLLAVLHSRKVLASLVAEALDLGLEPLVEAHDEQELDAALATPARVIGINNRDLRTLDVDPERASRMRELIPEDRIAIAESGVRDASTLRGWRALGFDAALVGETLVRAGDPGATVRAFVAAGRLPDDPVEASRAPFVKICGIVDEAGVEAAVRAGADAIGLNLVPGTPRALELEEAVALSAHARRIAPQGRVPLIVPITVDRSADDLRAIGTALDADAIQLSGTEPVSLLAKLDRPAWKVIHLPPATEAPPTSTNGSAASGSSSDSPRPTTAGKEAIARAADYLAAGAQRILLDTSGGPHPGGTGRRADPHAVAAVARELEVTLAGGLDPAHVGQALRTSAAVGVDVASGVEGPRAPGERPRKDPLKVALFAKRAREARIDRPNLAARPTPVNAGLLEADAKGWWGAERSFGGRYVPETLMGALVELEDAYAAIRHDPRYWAELRELLGTFVGRPTPTYRADRLAAFILDRAREAATGGQVPASLRLYLKREDVAHTGAHKINNALGQALLTRRLGKTRVIAETGAGQHGVATATALRAAGAAVRRLHGRRGHRAAAAERAPDARPGCGGPARSFRERDAQGRDQRGDARLGHERPDDPLRARVGDGPAPVPDDRARSPAADRRRGGGPAAARGRSASGSRRGLRGRWLERDRAAPAVHRRAGGSDRGRRGRGRRHRDRPARGSPRRRVARDPPRDPVDDAPGPRRPGRRGGLGIRGARLPGRGPQLSGLFEAGRLELAASTDDDAFAAMAFTAETEGILPALETAHAIAALPRLLAGVEGSGAPYPTDALVLLGFSGRGDKDLASFGRWRERSGQASAAVTDA